jgi:hypothetical protein
VGFLRHKAHTGVEGEGLTHDAQHDLGCMYIVFVFGEPAQVVVEIRLNRAIGKQVAVPGTILRSPG